METTIENRKAYHDYFVLEELECGIELKGHEVKSIRNGSVSLRDAWCDITPKNELILSGAHITKYDNAFDYDVNEKRDRRLLAHRGEIVKLSKKVTEKGMALIPLKMYFDHGKCKVLIGLCKGKHTYDKRNTLKERDIKREIERNSR